MPRASIFFSMLEKLSFLRFGAIIPTTQQQQKTNTTNKQKYSHNKQTQKSNHTSRQLIQIQKQKQKNRQTIHSAKQQTGNTLSKKTQLLHSTTPSNLLTNNTLTNTHQQTTEHKQLALGKGNTEMYFCKGSVFVWGYLYTGRLSN